jgi:hypothetical protein
MSQTDSDRVAAQRTERAHRNLILHMDLRSPRSLAIAVQFITASYVAEPKPPPVTVYPLICDEGGIGTVGGGWAVGGMEKQG